MKKLLTMVVYLCITTGILFANSKQYKTEELIITTTEKGFVIIGNELGDLKLTLDKVKTQQLKDVVYSYQELDKIAEKANYKTLHPPFMKSTDFKTIQFIYTHSAQDDQSTLSLIIEIESNGIYTKPYIITTPLEQWLVILNLIDEGFIYMDEVKDEILQLRRLENDISKE